MCIRDSPTSGCAVPGCFLSFGYETQVIGSSMTGRVAAQPRKAIPESVGIVSSMDLPPRQAMRMTTHDCQRINQRESAHPATGRGRRSAAEGLDRRRSTRRHQFRVDGTDLDLDRCSLSRGASENPSRYRTPVRAGEKTLTCADWSTAKAGALKVAPAAPTTGLRPTRTAQNTRRT